MIRHRWGRMALALLALAGRAAAQEEPAAPACEGRDPEAAPCRARYDSPPVLDSASATALPAGEARTPLVWMYVDATGAVRRAQVQRPTGPAWDIAARDRAKQLHFRPAALEGRPVAAWVLMPVAAVPPPASCAGASMSVPLSAGATFRDSVVMERPGQVTVFHYAGPGFPLDLFVYPRDGTAPRAQVEGTLAMLQRGLVRNGPESIVVLRAGAERLRPSDRFRRIEFAGYSALFRARLAGRPVESYIAVFPANDQDLKVRATYQPGPGAREAVKEFVQQILSYRAWWMSGCPG
ncbi:MAG: energy transducer TonB [Longimicrobiaceae bacterium]